MFHVKHRGVSVSREASEREGVMFHVKQSERERWHVCHLLARARARCVSREAKREQVKVKQRVV